MCVDPAGLLDRLPSFYISYRISIQYENELTTIWKKQKIDLRIDLFRFLFLYSTDGLGTHVIRGKDREKKKTTLILFRNFQSFYSYLADIRRRVCFDCYDPDTKGGGSGVEGLEREKAVHTRCVHNTHRQSRSRQSQDRASIIIISFFFVVCACVYQQNRWVEKRRGGPFKR